MSSSAKPIFGADRIIVSLAMVLGAVVLGTRLGWQDYWWDEHVTLMFTRSGWRELLIDYWALDTHRPVYYALQKGWNELFGESVAAVRALPVFLTLLTVPVFFVIARQIRQGRLAALVVLLLVSTPAFVYQGREIRMYCLLNLSLSVALMFLVILARRAQAGQSGISRKTVLLWSGFATAMAFAFYAQTIAAFVAVSFGLWILLAVFLRLLPLSFLWQAMAAGVLFAVMIVPALLPVFSHLRDTLGAGFWIPEPSLKYIYGQTAAVYAYPKWGKLLVGVLLIWGFWSLRRKPLICLLLAIIVIGFPLLVLLFSFLKPIYITRVIAWSGFVAVLVLASALANLPPVLRWGGTALLLFAQGVALVDFYPNTPERSAYEVFEQAFSDFEPARDTLVLGNQRLEAPLRWYYQENFQGNVYSLRYGDRNHDVFWSAYRSKFVPRSKTDEIQPSDGHIFIFKEARPRYPIPIEDQVEEALETIVLKHQLSRSIKAGSLQLDIYSTE